MLAITHSPNYFIRDPSYTWIETIFLLFPDIDYLLPDVYYIVM